MEKYKILIGDGVEMEKGKKTNNNNNTAAAAFLLPSVGNIFPI